MIFYVLAFTSLYYLLRFSCQSLCMVRYFLDVISQHDLFDLATINLYHIRFLSHQQSVRHNDYVLTAISLFGMSYSY